MLDASLSTLQLQMVLTRQMDMLADNIANVSTPGFKSEMLAVSAQRVRLPGGTELIAQPMTLERNMNDGAFTPTGNPLDLAIKGSGFFVVQTPLGERYTRNGHFQIDADGRLVTGTGLPVLGEGGQPIQFEPTDTDIAIGQDGTVSVRRNGEQIDIGTIGIVTFADPEKLQRLPGGLFLATAAPEPAQEARVIQGMIEESNVQSVAEITRMIDINRRFQAAQRIIEAESERSRKAMQVLTKTA
ncbi:MAG TPA: flagellar basal-body rod protein FlgF [Alphaproteobacteria bacterium]